MCHITISGTQQEVGHAQWVFVIPKMLRPHFLHHRALLGSLACAAWEKVLELMWAAVDDEELQPGMVAVVQTAGDLANWHPHVHAMVSRGKRRLKGEAAGLSRAERDRTPDARALRRSWGQLIKQIYEVDPLGLFLSAPGNPPHPKSLSAPVH